MCNASRRFCEDFVKILLHFCVTGVLNTPLKPRKIISKQAKTSRNPAAKISGNGGIYLFVKPSILKTKKRVFSKGPPSGGRRKY